MLTHTCYQKFWAGFSWCKTEILKYQFRKIHKGLFFFPAKLNFHLGELSAIQTVSMRGDEDRHHFFFLSFSSRNHIANKFEKGAIETKTVSGDPSFNSAKVTSTAFFSIQFS